MRKFLIIYLLTNVFITGVNGALAYSTSSGDSQGLSQFSDPNKITGGVADSVNQLIQNVFKGFSGGKGVNIDTNIPISPLKESSGDFNTLKLKNIVNTDNFSGQDAVGAIKAIIVLLINLFFVVIDIVIAVLKGLLEALEQV